MTDPIYSSIVKSLQEALKTKEHPFNYFSLATVGLSKTPRLRTILLRSVDADLNITFYTDSRSKKVTHIRENSNVSLLFFHPEKLMQFYIKGHASIVTDKKILQSLWNEIPAKSKKDYITELGPGTVINKNSKIDYLDNENYFCAIKIITDKIEYLELKQPNHVRVEYRKEADDWKHTYLIP